jgi:hypothetical protein
MHYSATTNGFYLPAIHGDKMPKDALAISDALYQALLGKHIEPGPEGLPREFVPTPTAAELLAMLTAALQGEMDARARALGYDDIKTAITYRGDPNPKFAAEAEGLFVWRSAVWTQAYALLAHVQQGQAQFPTIEEAVAMMPALVIDAPNPL